MSVTSQESAIRQLQDEFDRAELDADAAALRRLLSDDFLSIGPKGFVLDKEEWIGRHVHFTYESLHISERDIRVYDKAAVVRNVQRNRARYRDEQVELVVRVSQIWVDVNGQWCLAGIQFSPMAHDA